MDNCEKTAMLSWNIIKDVSLIRTTSYWAIKHQMNYINAFQFMPESNLYHKTVRSENHGILLNIPLCPIPHNIFACIVCVI